MKPDSSKAKVVESQSVSSESVAELTVDTGHTSSEIQKTAVVTGKNPSRPAETGAEPDRFQAALPRYDLNPRPRYPEVARRRGWEGRALFEVLVLKDGRVGELKMVQSSGYRSLDRAARKAIRGWVFKAAESAGSAVDSRVIVPVDFVLGNN